MDIPLTFGTLVVVILFLCYFLYKRRFSFWLYREVLTPPVPFLGNFVNVALQKETLALTMLKIYKFLKSKNVVHGGIYNFFCPFYVPVDINVIKSIMQTDFEHFTDRGIYLNEKDDPLSSNLFSQGGQKWKLLRSKLTPTFTPSKIKVMFETLLHCTEEMNVILRKSRRKPLNIKDISARYLTDVIGSCAFGIECNSLKEPNNDFQKKGSAFFERTFVENVMLYFSDSLPSLLKLMRVRVNRPDVSEFFMGLIRDAITLREGNNIHRKDFLQLLIELKHSGGSNNDVNVEVGDDGSEYEKLTFEEICAQSYLFFIAGFETSSATISFCLYSLAIHEDIQDKVRKEINEVINRNDGKLTYDSLAEMDYLENVINETLRLYPISSVLSRTCTKDYKVPGTNLLLKKGQKLYIPVMGIHYDEEFHPEPEKFDPERFSEAYKGNITSSTFMPFGDGPRNCIGLRLGMIQVKVALATLLHKHKFKLNEKSKCPLEFDVKHPLLSPKGGVWLDYDEIDD
ncbi:hypothetical protein WA026_009027 [Henosepilachna vigintioctopunctata]|uniref:Cytochrome P450 n=1 Tax=Henosepilachna vigintioctopunctata TaxID=420089 RepID=A0AAW1UV96_9CUCU